MTAPEVTMNSESPGSPWWKRTSLRRNRRVRSPGRQPLERRPVEAREELDALERLDRGPRPVHPAHGTCRALSADRQVARRSAVAGAAGVPRYSPGDLPLPADAAVGSAVRCAPDRSRLRAGLAAARYACVRAPRRVRRDRDPARLRAGRGRRPGRPDRAARLSGRHHRAHARRPLHRPRRRCATYSPGASAPRSGCRSSCRPVGAAASGRPGRRSSASGDGFFDDAFDIREYDPDAIGPDRRARGPTSCPVVTTSRPGASSLGRPTERGSSTPATPARTPSWSGRRAGRRAARRARRPSSAPTRTTRTRGHLTARRGDRARRGGRGRAGPDHPLPVGTTRGNARAPGGRRRAAGPRPAGARRHGATRRRRRVDPRSGRLGRKTSSMAAARAGRTDVDD